MNLVKITLMAHHVPSVVYLASGGRFSEKNLRYKHKIYGKEFNDNIEKWVRGMDPENTYVTILNSSLTAGDGFLDDLCLQGCPYKDNCSSKGSNAVFVKVLKRNWFLGIKTYLSALFNLRNTWKIDRRFPSGEYRLEYLIKNIKFEENPK